MTARLVAPAWRALSGRGYLRSLATLLGAAGLTLMLPLFIVVLPLAFIYRLLLEATDWPSWLRRA